MIKKMFRKCKVAKYIYGATVGKYKTYRRNKYFLKNGLKALYAIDDAFTELGIEYWLEFGTLLGAVRENAFISHDYDIDLGCFFIDYSDDNEKFFNKHGLKKVREFLMDDGAFGREETYNIGGVDIDIFYFHRRDDEMYCHLFELYKGNEIEESIIENKKFIVRELHYPFDYFKKLQFYDRTFLVPANIKEHLSASYGENYMIPDPNYSNSIATNVTILTNKIGILKTYE